MLPPPDLIQEAEAALSGLSSPWVPLIGGRVNHLWRCGEIVIKQYRPERATALFPNDLCAELVALHRFSRLGFAPECLAHGKDWLAYRHLRGQSWQSGAGQVAHLLGHLHRQGTEGLSLRHTLANGHAMAQNAQEMLAASGMVLCTPLAPPDEVAVAPVPLHGDPVPGNIIVGPAGAMLIDWQCPALGDPVLDLAIFLSPAMQHLYRGYPLSDQEVAEFLALYPDQTASSRYLRLRPWLHLRLASHCALRAKAGDPGYAAACLRELALLQSLGLRVEGAPQISVPIQTPVNISAAASKATTA